MDSTTQSGFKDLIQMNRTINRAEIMEEIQKNKIQELRINMSNNLRKQNKQGIFTNSTARVAPDLDVGRGGKDLPSGKPFGKNSLAQALAGATTASHTTNSPNLASYYTNSINERFDKQTEIAKDTQ